MPLEQKYLDLIAKSLPAASDPAALERLSFLYDRVVETNEKINITSLVSPIDVTLKHIIDSLTLLNLEEFQKAREKKESFCDIGCGGGFPGLPLASVSPEISLTMIDSTEKKILALGENAKALGLENVNPLWGRGEELAAAKGGLYREKFDFVMSRAVAYLPVLCELCLPFLKVGGVFCAMKGMKTQEEVKDSMRAIPMLGGKLKEVKEVKINLDFAYDLDFTEEEKTKIREFTDASRYFVVIEKKKNTQSIYPRKWAQMTKKSL